jgi:hypothetical protein
MTKRYFIYIHCRPNGEPFYVGNSCTRNRIFWLKRNKHYNNVVAKYGKENILIYLRPCGSKKQAVEHEIWMIAYGRAQGWKLTNMTNGGEGITDLPRSEEIKKKISKKIKLLWELGIRKGVPCSEEKKKKLSKKAMGHVGYMLNKHHTEEAKKKIGEKNKLMSGKKHWNFGRHLSEETKNKIRVKAEGRPSPLKGKKGKAHTDLTKEKLSLIGSGRPWSEYRRKAYEEKYGINKKHDF